MAEEVLRPLTTPFLFIQLQPTDARPTLQDVVRLLSPFVPFRFHNHQDSGNEERPHFRQIEFQQLETARKAYATVQNINVPSSVQQDTASIQLSLSINEDPTSDAVPPDGTRLNVSELPTSHCNTDPLYDLFKPFGFIYRIEMGAREGSASVTYYNPKSAKEAVMELHCTEIDGMAISVSQARVHDLKNTLKYPGYSSSTIGNGSGRRAFSAGSTFNGTSTSSFNGHGHKKMYSHASGHRATCGVGPKPYGLSATAEPYDPLRKGPTSSPRSPSSPFPPSSTSGLLESSPGVPLVIRSVSRPVPLHDPTKLTIQNLPLELDAPTLYTVLSETFIHHHDTKSSSPSSSFPQQSSIILTEATLTYDEDRKKSMGIAFVAFENEEQASIALKILNGNYLLGYGGVDRDGMRRMPLRVKVLELGGFVEKGLSSKGQKADEEGPKAGAGKNCTKEADDPQAVIAESVEQTTHTSPPVATAMTPAQISKYRKLLSTALDDLSTDEKKSLFRSDREKARLLNALVKELPETELKRCIFEDDYLKVKCEPLKDSYWNKELEEEYDNAKMDDSGTSEDIQAAPARKGSESPTRVYDRKELLELHTPHSPVHEKTEATIRTISPTTSTRPLPPTSPSNYSRLERAGESNQLTMEDLIKLSVKDIIQLACARTPPTLLASRNAETVKEVERFLQGIRDLKLTQQKQKIGEKVFKVFKSKAPGMKNISKRTVMLLDGEDLGALLHLTEEFPDVLVAKAALTAV